MRWRVNPGNGSVAGLEADFTPLCPHCGTALLPVAIKLLNFQLNEPGWWERGEKNAYAIDIETWCPTCGYWAPFGVACPADHWKKIWAETAEVYAGAHTKVAEV